MSERALEFIETWVSDNIFSTSAPRQPDRAGADALADNCRAAAHQAGITDTEIGEQFDSLAQFIAGQIDEAAERLSAKDD